ncbi:hypothetical protein AU074_27635 [Pseudomonas sp. ATCC PTA-122608]|nr:hypothetical protein AU074_27635 [Pseudomonas sp. ATCC PTA-122608]
MKYGQCVEQLTIGDTCGKSGHRGGRRFVRESGFTRLFRLVGPGIIRAGLAWNAACGGIGHQRPGHDTNLVGFKPGEFGADSRIELHRGLLKRGPARCARVGAVHSIECMPADKFP